ncbi:uncharacterized protein LOC131651460 [Vicia villosa]|uniref:uncharacterized protein LOC131651460 n=1 Tax=Vicia villosa TaxID=3911 RepID=UPI00273CA1D3|nr:uncharacterized protein LOC131651460 [Vicia villosa]
MLIKGNKRFPMERKQVGEELPLLSSAMGVVNKVTILKNVRIRSGSMVIDTHANGSVNTTYVCLSYPLTIFGKSFMMDSVCLPLHQNDVILGMNWLKFNYVHINCYKTLRFPKCGYSGELVVLSAKQVNELLDDKALMFAMFLSLQVDREAASVDLPVVCEFLEVFIDDISDLPLEREVMFAIELVPSTSSVSTTPCRMSASELNELKKQLGELLEKKFVRSSVSPWGAPVLLVKKKDGSMTLCVHYT